MNSALQTRFRKDFSKEMYSFRYLDRVAHSGDASFFKQIPQVVFFPENEKDVLKVINISKQEKIPLTFRAAATSLSGQTLGTGIIVDISRHFRNYNIAENGKKIKVGPAVVMDHANVFLKPYGKRLGPDPASGKACMVGGVVANNASGITSGIVLNPYKTISSLRFVLPSGTIVDSSLPDADILLQKSEPDLYEFLSGLKSEIRSDVESVEKIKHLYSMKNTVGYSINAFLDYDKPLDILTHLMIGSEGTLGFISEAEFNTVDDKPYKATSLLGFGTLEEAGEAVLPFAKAGMAAVEILSASALETVRTLPGMPDIIQKIPHQGAALLIEAHGADEDELSTLIDKARVVIADKKIDLHTGFMEDEIDRLKLWKARKSLFATVGANRPEGSTVITEDVVTPPDKLVEAINGVSRLLSKYGFDKDSVIFGHAKDSSLHFNFSVDFSSDERKSAFIALSDELANLICEELNGALKGEHGTGRAVVSYVGQQWGSKIYNWMRIIKKAVDPENVMNPGVLIDLDGDSYPEIFKENTVVDASIDRCVDCGFCESQCPSRFLTLTPRQRIVVWREMQRLKNVEKKRALYREMSEQFRYYGEATCAADGLCQLNCPVDINTGTFIKDLRAKNKSNFATKLSLFVEKNWYTAERLARSGLTVTQLFAKIGGEAFLKIFTKMLNQINQGVFPVWNRFIPRTAKYSLPGFDRSDAEFLYFPSCINRMMGSYRDEPGTKSVINSLIHICSLSEINIIVPPKVENYCCGLPLSSKGYHAAFIQSARKMVDFLYAHSDEGRLPILVDTSPCTLTMLHYDDVLGGHDLEKWKKLIFIDVVAFLNDEVLKDKNIPPLSRKVALHPVCSVKKMSLEEKFDNVARSCAKEVVDIPITGCCATAGDRGFHYPELSRSATKIEADYLKERPAENYYSSSRTCEIGMSDVSGKPFESIVFLVEEYLQSSSEQDKK